MINIHPVHRRLAEITYMSTDKDGNTFIGMPELQLLIPLLRQNLELVRRVDELKNLSYEAYLAGDVEWVQELEERLKDLEAHITPSEWR